MRAFQLQIFLKYLSIFGIVVVWLFRLNMRSGAPESQPNIRRTECPNRGCLHRFGAGADSPPRPPESRSQRDFQLVSMIQFRTAVTACLKVFGAAFVFHTALASGQTKATELQVKAAYLYNFGKFVRWTEAGGASDARFTICVLGKDPFDGALDSVVSGESIAGKPLAVKRVADRSSVTGCRVLYVSGSEARRFSSLLQELRRMPILTVSDAPDFLRQGGIIQFVTTNDRVRFEVNLPAAQDAGIQLSSELLKVAVKVVGSDTASGQERPR